MVHFQENKLIIELEHPYPKEAVKDLRLAIINALKAQWLQEGERVETDMKECNIFLLELLKEVVDCKV